MERARVDHLFDTPYINRIKTQALGVDSKLGPRDFLHLVHNELAMMIDAPDISSYPSTDQDIANRARTLLAAQQGVRDTLRIPVADTLDPKTNRYLVELSLSKFSNFIYAILDNELEVKHTEFSGIQKTHLGLSASDLVKELSQATDVETAISIATAMQRGAFHKAMMSMMDTVLPEACHAFGSLHDILELDAKARIKDKQKMKAKEEEVEEEEEEEEEEEGCGEDVEMDEIEYD